MSTVRLNVTLSATREIDPDEVTDLIAFICDEFDERGYEVDISSVTEPG